MKLKQTINGGKPVWVIDGTINGKRRRIYFPIDQKEQAKRELAAILKDQKMVGRKWAQLPPTQRVDVTEVLDEVTAAGLTIRDVWEAYKENMSTIVSIGITGAVEMFIQDKESASLSDRYIGSLESDLVNFANALSGRTVESIKARDVRLYLAKYDVPVTRSSVHTRLGTFFEWARKQGYCSQNPVSVVQKPKVVHASPELLSVADCRRLLAETAIKAPDSLSALVLKLFAGVRPAEAARLSEGDFDLDQGILVISAAASKTRQRRVVTLEPAAVEWLRHCWPYAYTDRDDRAIREVAKGLGIEWQADMLRHTCATHLYGLHGEAKAAAELGNSEQVLHRHYRALVTPAETAGFWQLRPSDVLGRASEA